jgi:predicted GNAT family N-acyltransferase
MTKEKELTCRYVISHLEKKHDRNQFTCGIETLDRYLKTQASQDIRKNVAVTYVLTKENSAQVLGYYTLSSMGIFPGELPDELIKRLPRYPILPGILLGRLAVDVQFHGKKLGIYLLLDALKRSLTVSDQIGIIAVIVDAIDDAAIKFYKKYGFIGLGEDNHRLFLPLNTIKKLDL